MDQRLTDEYKEKENNPPKPRVRRTATLSSKAKEHALNNFKGTDGKKQDIAIKSAVIRDNLKHR